MRNAYATPGAKLFENEYHFLLFCETYSATRTEWSQELNKIDDIQLSGSEDEIVKAVMSKAALKISARFIEGMYHERRQWYSNKMLGQTVMRRVRRRMHQILSSSVDLEENHGVSKADSPVADH